MTQPFHLAIASELAAAFAAHGVEYVLIGKGGAIVLGYPGTTLDVDVFPAKSAENAERIVLALRSLGFDLPLELEGSIRARRDFVQIKNGPFQVDLIFAPDGIESYAPVAFSNARTFRPSRPMIRPFISSLGISTVLVVESAV